MRILIASMPLLALVTIFSATAQRRIDTAARSAAAVNDKALPECAVIMQRVTQNKQFRNAARSEDR